MNTFLAHFRRGVLLVSALFSTLLFLPLSVGATDDAFEISGWVPYWKVASGTASVSARIDLFTEVNPFVYTVKTDGTLNQASSVDGSNWVSLQALAKEKNVRYVPTVMWGDGDAIHAVLSDPAKRKAHIASIMREVYRYGFDGIDIDYEAKHAETRPYFSLFLKELNEAIGWNKWIMCTIEPRTPLEARYKTPEDVPANIEYANEYKDINSYCDRVRIMAYDQGRIDVRLNAANPDPYIPIADPKWVEKVVRLTMQDIDPDKIMIGIPTYGYEYDMFPVEPGTTTMRYARLWSFSPNYIAVLKQKLGLSTTRHGSGEAMLTFPAATSPEPEKPLPGATRVLVWDDAQAVNDKVALAQSLGIRGVSFFKIDGGQDPELWNVLLTIPKKIATGAQKTLTTTAFDAMGPSATSQNTVHTSASTPSTAAFTLPTINLESGMRSEDVRTLQKYLNAQGFTVRSEGLGSPGQETDFFGAGTRNALIRFQQRYDIAPAVGYYGPITRAKMASLGR